MGIGDILWLFFMFSALQPIVHQKMLEASRLRVLSRFERARKSRVISLVHRQETMSFLGFPVMRYIDVNDSEEVLRAIKLTDPDCPIDLIIHTPGGPVLGPVDPQLGQQPAASVLKVLEAKKPEDIDDETLILADVSRKAIVQVHRTVQELLSERMSAEQASALAEKLSTGVWTHDYPITSEEGKSLGLPISTEVPQEVYDFMRLFPQPTRTRPAVEYEPARYGTREGRRLSQRQP